MTEVVVSLEDDMLHDAIDEEIMEHYISKGICGCGHKFSTSQLGHVSPYDIAKHLRESVMVVIERDSQDGREYRAEAKAEALDAASEVVHARVNKAWNELVAEQKRMSLPGFIEMFFKAGGSRATILGMEVVIYRWLRARAAATRDYK